MAVTRSFVVKNGIEVAEDLIYTKDNKVGIATTVPEHKFDVNGDTFFRNQIFLTNNPNDILVSTTTGIVSSTSLGTISGIDTTGIIIGDNVEGDFIQTNTKVVSIGTDLLGIFPNHGNVVGISTTSFSFKRYSFAGEVGNAIVSNGPGNAASWGDPIASFATTSKNVIGGIGDITQLKVSPGLTDVKELQFDNASSKLSNGTVTASRFIGIANTSIDVDGGFANITTLTASGDSNLQNTTINQTLNVFGKSTLSEVEADSYRVGVGPSLTKFQIDEYNLFSKTGTFTAVVGLGVTIDSFTAAENYRVAEYTIVLESSTSIQAQKVLVMQNGTNAFSEEYGIIYNPSVIVAIGASINASGGCNFVVTPVTGTSGIVTYRILRNSLR
jgi:hypothetical protein